MKKLLFFALLAGAALAGCDQLRDAASLDFTVDDIRFEFSTDVENGSMYAPATTGTATRAGEMNSFSVTRTVNLSEIGDSDISKYADKIFKIKVNSSLINIAVSSSGDYTVENLKIEAVGVAGSPLIVPSYTVGGTFTPPAGMDDFTSALVMKLLGNGSVEVTVSGQTDAPTGTTVNISYENDLVFSASLL